jgi:type II secretory pathway pseudopilin PulG
MTLPEVVVALAIFAGALLTMAVFISRFSHNATENRLRDMAGELASDRLESARSIRPYSAIDTMHNKTESSFADYPTFTRTTQVARVGGGAAALVDYKAVTVTVSARGLTKPVKKTTIISGF